MEQIYTIPVNEAFEESLANTKAGCPFCRLYKKLEENELELILGASMMEPDVRQKTNRQGFCPDHWKKLASAGKRLPLALILQSHLAEIDKMLKKPGITPSLSGAESAKQLLSMSDDCYICRRIDYNFDRMTETAALLWDSDGDFREKFAAQTCLCLRHCAHLISTAKRILKMKSFSAFYKAVYEVENKYTSAVREKIDSFAKRFDYRYANEPSRGEESAVEDAVCAIIGTET